MQPRALDDKRKKTHSGDVLHVTQAEDFAENLGAAIREALKEAGRTQQWLADQLPLDPSQVSRLLSGQAKSITVYQVLRVEHLLGLGNGELLRRAGIVAPMQDTEAAILADQRIGQDRKTAMLDLYRSAAVRSPSKRSSRASKREP